MPSIANPCVLAALRRRRLLAQSSVYEDISEMWSNRRKNDNGYGLWPYMFSIYRKKVHTGVSGGAGKELGRNFAFFEREKKQGFLRSYNFRPLLVLYRASYIMAEVTMLSVWHYSLKDIQKRADKLRRCLIRLGPFYIKLGQALSTRPDILPNAYCQELAKLQDQIPPFPTSIALQFIESELGSPARKLFAEISEEPVAAASLGQVYKACLSSGELVAVKVQRPGVHSRLALDSYLLRIVGGPLQRFLGARRDILAAVNEMVEHMFEEIDYVKEGKNAERFGILYGGQSINEKADDNGSFHSDKDIRSRRKQSLFKTAETADIVKVPKIYWKLTSRSVLTMEWIDGIKLTDLETLRKLGFDIQCLVDQGVFCSLRQLLEEGFFHADPHPGNLVVTKEGTLAYFDFGMMGDFPRNYRIGLIRTLVHFVNRDSVGLANDFAGLGFVPEGSNLEEISHALHVSFGDESAKAQLDFQGIMNQLSNVMYKYNFSLPPEYALVIRALGSLEGTATLLDPEFKVVASAYPFVIGRLLADPDPDMRQILRELLIRNNGSIRWHRLERLVMAIAEQSATPPSVKNADGSRAQGSQDGLGKVTARTWGSFDTRTVVSATSDLLEFILSDQGYRVRVLLVRDIVNAFRGYLDEISERYILSSQRVKGFGGYLGTRGTRSSAHGHSTVSQDIPGQDAYFGSRVLLAMKAFFVAVESAPELWLTLFARFSTKTEAQALVSQIAASLAECFFQTNSEYFWYSISVLLHKLYDTNWQ